MDTGIGKKLRLQKEQLLTILNRPSEDYFSEFQVLTKFPRQESEVLILFVYSLEELKDQVDQVIQKKAVKEEGRLFLAYPKKGNVHYDTYIHRDEIFPALQVDEEGFIAGTDYKFNQMVKLDDTFTIVGIKRTTIKKKNSKKSQSVQDYISDIPKIREYLEKEKQALLFFESLTPGYQRNWARYIYSAKQEATQEKRKEEVLELLKQKKKAK